MNMLISLYAKAMAVSIMFKHGVSYDEALYVVNMWLIRKLLEEELKSW